VHGCLPLSGGAFCCPLTLLCPIGTCIPCCAGCFAVPLEILHVVMHAASGVHGASSAILIMIVDPLGHSAIILLETDFI
ncbi:hypothetical protein H0E87_002058, partial [Populus deltoides]